MPVAKIANPSIFQEAGANQSAVQKNAFPEASGANGTWLNNSFVYTSGTGASTVLNVCASAATVIYGLEAGVGKGASAATTKPPDALFGTSHYPFDPRDRIFEINITANADANIGTANGVTYNGGGTGGVALAPGQQYGIRKVTTAGAYIDMQFLDVSNTTQKVFEIVGCSPNNAPTDNNTRVLVKVLPSVIQA